MYIPVSAVATAGGFAFTASHFRKACAARRKVTKALLPRHSVPRPGSACLTPAARRHRPSLPRCPLCNACVRPLGKGRQIKSQSQSKIKSFASKPAPTGGHLQETGRLSGRLRSDAATRQASSHKKSERIRCAFHHSTGRALARLQLLMLTHRPLERPSGGSAQWATRHGCRVSRARPWMADRGGPTEQDRSEGMPSLGEAPNERGKSVLVTLALFQSDPL